MTLICIYIYIYVCMYVLVFVYIFIAWKLICDYWLYVVPGRVIPETLKMVLDTSLLNTQQYKVNIKGKVEQSKERSRALPYTLV